MKKNIDPADANPLRDPVIVTILVAMLIVVAIILLGANQVFGQSARPAPFVVPQYFDSNGDPLNAGLLYTCTAGGSCPGSPLATWTDSTLGSQNANPVVLDAAGRPTATGIYLGPNAYKFVLKTSAGVTVWTQDNIPGNTITLANAQFLLGLNSGSVSKQIIGITAGDAISIDGSALNAVTLGTNVSTAGDLRTYHGWSLFARDNANTNNRRMLDFGETTTDTLTLGDTGAAVTIIGTGVMFTGANTTTITNNGAVGGCLAVGTTTGCASGTINVSVGITKNGSTYTNPGYTFEKYLTQKVERYAGTELGRTYPGLMPLDELDQYVRTNYELPRVGKVSEVFDRLDVLLEKVEEQALYILELHKRIRALEETPRLAATPPDRR